MPPLPKSEHIKRHVKKYQTVYVVIVVAGVSYYIGTRVGPSRVLSPAASIFGINNKLDQRVITLADRKGPPSWVIGRADSDLEWNSMKETAIAEGLRIKELRDHLNGRLPDVNGKRYFRKGLAAA